MMHNKRVVDFRRGFFLAALVFVAALTAVSCLGPVGIEVAGLRKQASVVLDLKGADPAGYQLFLEPNSNGTVTPPALNPARQGYSFGGWYADSACLTPFDFAGTIITRTTVIYAKWNEIRWTLRFLWNDGTGGEYGQQSVLNGYYAIWMAPPSRSGYGFSGWYTDAACTAAFTFDQVITQAQNLYAGWDAPNRYVHYSMNYEGGAVTSQPYALGATVSAGMLPAPNRTGYHFGGWYISPDCAGQAWTGGVMNQDKTVYAKWQAITYTISFFKGPSWQDQTYSVQVEHGRLLPQITPAQLTDPHNAAQGSTLSPGSGWAAQTGWGFIHWKTIPGNIPWDFQSPVTGSLQLIGVWAQNQYTVTLERMNGMPAEQIPGISSGSTPHLGAEPTKAGHTFGGWFTDLLYSQPYVSGPLFYDITLYAKWDAQTHTVTFDANGGTPAAPVSYNAAYGQRAVPPVTPPVKAGHTFTGWYAAPAGGSPVDFTGPAAIITGNKAFYAQWTALTTYAVTFNLNGGTLSGLSTPVSVIAGQRVIAPTGVPTRTGYIFTGWYNAASGGSLWDFSSTVTGAATIHAQWASNAVSPSEYYTVTLNSTVNFKIKIFGTFYYASNSGGNYTYPWKVQRGLTVAAPEVVENGGLGRTPSGFSPPFPLTITGDTTITIHW